MITKFQKFLITESPDHLDDDDKDYHFWADDARPFFADVNSDHTKVEHLFLGSHGGYHSDMSAGINKAYAGRLWENIKIMSFWVYPNVSLFKQIIEKLEKKLKTKIFNNGWRIEVLTNYSTGDIEMADYDPDVLDNYFRPNDQKGDEIKIIPVEQYVGSENVPEEQQIQHLMKWQEKELAKKLGKMHFPKGFGSDKTAWDSPHNIKWRQAIYQENKIYKQ